MIYPSFHIHRRDRPTRYWKTFYIKICYWGWLVQDLLLLKWNESCIILVGWQKTTKFFTSLFLRHSYEIERVGGKGNIIRFYLRCRPLYEPDMLAALLYHWPWQLTTSIPNLSNVAVTCRFQSFMVNFWNKCLNSLISCTILLYIADDER